MKFAGLAGVAGCRGGCTVDGGCGGELGAEKVHGANGLLGNRASGCGGWKGVVGEEVLGEDVFVSRDGDVIRWRVGNYRAGR